MENKLIIYLPAFNEAERVHAVIERLPKKLDKITAIQILVVDDGSTDNTAQIAKSSGAQVVSHNVNKGVGAAFHSAVQYALEHGANYLVSIDADGQFDSGEITDLIQPLISNNADLVIGNRFSKGKPNNMVKIKYWGNKWVSTFVGYLCHQKFTDVSCGFRAYNREALLHLNIFGSFTYTHEVILNLIFQGLRVVELPISIQYFQGRKSRVANSIINYTYRTSKIILRSLIDYSPMRVLGSLCIILFFIGICFTGFLFGHYIMVGSFTPYKSTGFIGLGFAILGLLVFLIALIADMLNRIRINQDRQLYEIKKTNYGR